MPGIRAITDLHYGLLVFFLNKAYVSIGISQYVLINNIEPVFLVITDLDHG